MYNKSREKLIPKPPNTHKEIKPLTKYNQNTLPNIHKPKTSSNLRAGSSQQSSQIKSIGSSQIKRVKPVSAAKPIPRKVQKRQQGVKNKLKMVAGGGWAGLPLNLLLQVSSFCTVVAFDVYRLSLVCSTWRQYMDCHNAIFFWNRFKITEKANNFKQYKMCLQQNLVQLKQKRSSEFEAMYTKLFNYGSTKQNLANKLISKLKLDLQVMINKKKLPAFPFKLRQFNFSSYLYAKVNELSAIQFDMYTAHNMFKDHLQITFTFYSRTFKVGHCLNYKLTPEQIASCAIKQKAFNYFICKNLIITFFQGDQRFLYCFLEISALELVTHFRKAIKQQFQQHLTKQNKKIPLYKQLAETDFQDFVQYIKFQADFELHLSYHNSQQQIFTHADTKVYPLDYDQSHAYFQVPIRDTFKKVSTFLLDNKSGMSENIQDLYLLDFVLKDRDRFLIVFSGFIYAREASQKERESIQNFFNFHECLIKILQFKESKYDFSIMVIEQPKKNFIHHARFQIRP